MGRGRRQDSIPGSSKRLRWLDTVSSPLCCGIADDDDDDDDESIDDDDSTNDDGCCSLLASIAASKNRS